MNLKRPKIKKNLKNRRKRIDLNEHHAFVPHFSLQQCESNRRMFSISNQFGMRPLAIMSLRLISRFMIMFGEHYLIKLIAHSHSPNTS